MSIAPEQTKQVKVMKVLLLGQSNVGKTSLVTRYTMDKFDAQCNLLTVGIDIRKMQKYLNGTHILLQLWDTAGQQKYRTIPNQYFRGVQDCNSYIRIQDWLQKVEQNQDTTKVQLCLIGNKLDLQKCREVNKQQAQKYAYDKNMKYTETSAKNSINVDEVFQRIISCILQSGIKCPIKCIKLDKMRQGLAVHGQDQNQCCK